MAYWRRHRTGARFFVIEREVNLLNINSDEKVKSELDLCFEAMESIGATASRKEKEALLEDMRGNNKFRELLWWTYNPYKMFYVRKFGEIDVANSGPVNQTMYFAFIDLLRSLSSRQITGNAALERIEAMFKLMNITEQKWYSRVLLKDLKIGMTSSTFNKVFTEDQIPTFSCSLAQTYNRKKLPKRFAIEPKLDGYRCLAIHRGDYVELRTRNGKELTGYRSIEEAVKLLTPGYVYDGEIMSESGTFSDMQKVAFKKDVEDKPGVFNLFDMIPIDEFYKNASTESNEIRRNRLGIVIGDIRNKGMLPNVLELVEQRRYTPEIMEELFEGIDPEEKIMENHRMYLAKGYEGSMIKDLDAVYECKRSWSIQKVKDMDTLDLIITAVQPGLPGSKLEYTMGAVTVEYKGYEVNVGSGFSESMRNHIWDNRNEMINKVIEVKYFEETKDKEGNLSLRFPIFMGFRDDKE